jgi:hypothetical protein
MCTAIVFTIVFSIVGIYIGRKYPNSLGTVKSPVTEWVKTCSLFGGALGCVAAVLLGFVMPRVNVDSAPIELAAVDNVEGMKGTFLYGSGSVRSNLVYNFLIRNVDGSMTPNSVVADGHVRIVQDKNLSEVGYLTITVSKVEKSTAFRYWALDISPREEIVAYEFRVPDGSVKQSFRFN